MNVFSTLLVVTPLLVGCGYAALPSPTQRNVTNADIIGVWKYPADFGETSVTLDLKPDGTFVQTVTRTGPTEPQVHTGNWNLDGVWLNLTLLKPEFGFPDKAWVLEQAQWSIVDSWRDDLEFAIFGAADDRDPDSCHEFKKVR